jgi:hypothetical protein
MPLPLFIPIIAALAGAYGVGRTAVAAHDSGVADDINSDAERLVYKCQSITNDKRECCNHSLEEFGRKKFDAITKTLARFVDQYGKLKNVELDLNKNLGDLAVSDFDDNALAEMKKEVSMLNSSAMGIGSGAAGGAMAAFGAYSGTMMLASAGTGTAIGTLGGAAATNATLAWLGGGTLASGGMGMAGGVAVLGALAAGPALLIFGAVLGAKADQKFNDARANREEAEAFESETNVVITKLEGITEVTELISGVFSTVRSHCRRACNKLEAIIEASGTDYSKYTEQQQATVFKAVKFAQLTKVIIDTAILDEEGNLLEDASANINRVSEQIG